jgi:hypothetical protein
LKGWQGCVCERSAPCGSKLLSWHKCRYIPGVLEDLIALGILGAPESTSTCVIVKRAGDTRISLDM